MYRIKLANGTILEFDSLDTLTVDIHAGVVDTEALIFHQRANQWLPIHVHPAWKQALATPRKSPVAPPRAPSAGASSAQPSAAPRNEPRAEAPIAPPHTPTRPPAPGPGRFTGRPKAAPNASGTPVPSSPIVPKPSPFSPKASAAPKAVAVLARQVSVDHLDEELELLGADDAALLPPVVPAVVVVAATEPRSVPKPKSEPVLESEPRTSVAAEKPVAAPEPVLAPVHAPIAAPPMTMALPESKASAESLVSSATLMVEPADEAPVLELPNVSGDDDALATDELATSDLTTDLATAPALELMHFAEPPPSDDDAPQTIEAAPEPAMTPGDASPPTLPHASVSTARNNRTLWYAGGAAAAAGVVIAALALRGDGKAAAESSSTAAPPTEQRSANPGLPGAPLAPPTVPALVLPEETLIEAAAGARGRIEPAEDPAATVGSKDANDARAGKLAKPDAKARDAKDTATSRDDSASDRSSEIGKAPTDFRSLAVPGLVTVKFDASPSALASRYLARQDAAWNDLVARLRLAGFDNLFAASRVTPAGSGTARTAVAAARTQIAQWRTRSTALERAYRDTASSLASSGNWDAAEQREYDTRAARAESGESAQQTNAILGAADRLFGILAANRTAYEVTADGLRFTDSGTQRDYWETRRALLAAIDAAGTESQTPLALVKKAIGSTRPPEGINAN